MTQPSHTRPSRGRTLLALAALSAGLLAVGLLACQTPMPGATAAPDALRTDLVMRAYDVPRAYASEVQNVLGSLLYRGKDLPKAGSVALSPGGQLLVAAPAAFHEGVVVMLERMKSTPPTPPPAIEMDYWVVLGRPAKDATIPDNLKADVAPALEEIVKAEGPMEFALLDRLKLRSTSGDDAEVSSPFFTVRQEATVLEGKVLANVRLFNQRGRGNIDLRTQLEADKLLILGEAGHEVLVDEPFWEATEKGSPRRQATAFYVVRARIAGQ